MYQLEYKDKVIKYDIVKSNIKNVYIHIKDNYIIVKAPKRLKDSQIIKAIESKKDWIYKKVCKHQEKKEDYIKILGKNYKLDIHYVEEDKTNLEILDGKVIVNLPKTRKEKDNRNIVKNIISNHYMNIAEKEVAMQMALVTRVVGLKPNKYRIKKLKSAWGTCTSNKNITINSELMKFDREVIQYVVLHEICHLKYMNHSKEFWSMVEKYMKNYKEVKSRLKE